MARAFLGSSSQYLQTSTAPRTAQPLSMGLWFNLANTTGNHCLLALTDKDTDVDWFALSARGDEANDLLVFERNNTDPGNPRASSTVGYSANTWHHGLAVTSANNSAAVYLDGGNKGTNTDSVIPAGIDRFSVGRLGRLNPVAYTTGNIAEVAVWNVALSDADAATLAKGVSPLMVRPDALVSYWPLLGRYTTEIDERSGNGLTVTGATYADHPRIIYPRRERIWQPPAVAAGTLRRLLLLGAG